jgi:hypothetical protein
LIKTGKSPRINAEERGSKTLQENDRISVYRRPVFLDKVMASSAILPAASGGAKRRAASPKKAKNLVADQRG